MRTRSIATRLLLLFVVSALSAAIIFGVGVYTAQRLTLAGASEAQQVMLSGERAKIKTATESMAQVLSAGLAGIQDPSARVDYLRAAIKTIFFEPDRSGYYYIYRGTTNVAHPVNPALQDRDLGELKGSDGVYSVRELADQAAAGGGFVDFRWDKPGKGDMPKIGYATMIPGTDYWIGTGVYVDNVDEAAAVIASRLGAVGKRMGLLDAGVFAVLFLCALLPLSLLVSRGIVRPIRQTIDTAKRIADGDLDVHFAVHGEDEVSLLQQALERMAGTLKGNLDALAAKQAEARSEAEQAQQAAAMAQKAVRDVEAAHATMLETVDALSGVVTELGTATNDLTALGGDIRQGAENQQERLEETVAAMTQMHDAVGEVARNAAEAAQATGLTRETATEGEVIVTRTVEAMGGLKTMADTVKNNMGQLGVQSDGIGAVIQVISEIADQTNLLALNAAIEAARAGDAGRGFAVVADEVRKLAEKTMAATGEVGQNIQAIQAMTRETLDGVDKTLEAVDATAQLAADSGEKLRHIRSAAEQAAAQVRAIAAAADQQAVSARSIMDGVGQVSAIARDNAGRAQDASRHFHNLSQQAMALTGLISQLDQTQR